MFDAWDISIFVGFDFHNVDALRLKSRKELLTLLFRKLLILRKYSIKAELASLPEGKLLINTIKAHSFNTAKKDQLFADALTNGDVLIPDGVSIVKACKWIKAKSQPKERIAGWDLFSFEMNKLKKSGTVMFMGSSQKVLDLIVKRAAVDYPHLKVVTYSPPYKP